jgi:DNA-binding XRE family transcriptional regulator
VSELLASLVKTTRTQAALTQQEAAEMIHLQGGRAAWTDIERGRTTLDAARWELFKIKTGNHKLYKPVAGNHVPTKEDSSPGVLLGYYYEQHRKARGQ